MKLTSCTFEVFQCPNADHHKDRRLTSWCMPYGTQIARCPEDGTIGVHKGQGTHYCEGEPQPWHPYGQLYQITP